MTSNPLSRPRFRFHSPALRIGVAAPLLAGCVSRQSALHPAADDAAILAALCWLLFVGAGVILLGVMVATWLAARGRSPRFMTGSGIVVGGGIAFPVLVLTALLAYGLWVLRETNAAPEEGDALRIEVVGEQYWWRIAYPAAGDAPRFDTANEIRVPVGQPVQIDVTSADVIHAFWIPSFAGKIDMIPGRLNTMRFTATREGVYRGVCTEFCGEQHALMAFDVVALTPEDFAAWRTLQSADASPPTDALLEEGKAVFERGGCGTCHAVRGTGAAGRLGPDLSHVGSRLSIGAGAFPNNAGTLGGWIADTQGLKPGAKMPSYGSLSGRELRAIASYLESLK